MNLRLSKKKMIVSSIVALVIAFLFSSFIFSLSQVIYGDIDNTSNAIKISLIYFFVGLTLTFSITYFIWSLTEKNTFNKVKLNMKKRQNLVISFLIAFVTNLIFFILLLEFYSNANFLSWIVHFGSIIFFTICFLFLFGLIFLIISNEKLKNFFVNKSAFIKKGMKILLIVLLVVLLVSTGIGFFSAMTRFTDNGCNRSCVEQGFERGSCMPTWAINGWEDYYSNLTKIGKCVGTLYSNYCSSGSCDCFCINEISNST